MRGGRGSHKALFLQPLAARPESNGPFCTESLPYPDEPESVARAVRAMELAVDAKAAPYSHNAMVKAFLPEAKKSFEKCIRQAKKD